MNDDKDDDAVFTFDLSVGMGPDGKLTDEGRAALMAKMVERVKRRAPDVDVAKMTEAFERMLRGTDEEGGVSVFEMSARSVIDICGRMAFAMKDLPRGVRALAQALAAEKGAEALPHVFGLGEASSYLASAHALIDTAMTILVETVQCEKTGTHGDSHRAAARPKPGSSSN